MQKRLGLDPASSRYRFNRSEHGLRPRFVFGQRLSLQAAGNLGEDCSVKFLRLLETFLA